MHKMIWKVVVICSIIVVLIVPLQNETAHESDNMFDAMQALAAPRTRELRNEIDRYLSTDVEETSDVLMWWRERRSMFPKLARMATDYLSIPRAVMLLHLLTTVPEVKTNAGMIGVDTWHQSNRVAGDMGGVISIRSSLTTIDFNTNVSNNQALGVV
jgi:hypothetical protein